MTDKEQIIQLYKEMYTAKETANSVRLEYQVYGTG